METDLISANEKIEKLELENKSKGTKLAASNDSNNNNLYTSLSYSNFDHCDNDHRPPSEGKMNPAVPYNESFMFRCRENTGINAEEFKVAEKIEKVDIKSKVDIKREMDILDIVKEQDQAKKNVSIEKVENLDIRDMSKESLDIFNKEIKEKEKVQTN